MTDTKPRAPLAFVDTETTGLDPDRHEVWETFLHVRYPADDEGKQQAPVERHWYLPVNLAKADPIALTIGRYYDRFCEPHVDTEDATIYLDESTPVLEAFATEFAVLTHGAHLVAAVPSFDDAFLRRLLVKNGACPGWHYHLIDVEALAIGYAAAHSRLGHPLVIDDGERHRFDHAPPWDSSRLTEALGLDVDDETKHTAEGDVRWAIAMYDKVMGS